MIDQAQLDSALREVERQPKIELSNTIVNCLKQVQTYLDRNLQQKARSLMPIQRWQAVIEEKQLSGQTKTELKIRMLLEWFKGEFFSWVDKLACENCSANETEPIGYVQPLIDDLRWGASRVEAFKCRRCSSISRFPRYNDGSLLLLFLFSLSFFSFFSFD